MSDRNNMKLFTLNSNPEIAQKIADTVGVPLGKLSSRQFSDGEIQVNIEESVRGYDVYIIQSISKRVFVGMTSISFNQPATQLATT